MPRGICWTLAWEGSILSPCVLAEALTTVQGEIIALKLVALAKCNEAMNK